MSTLSKQVRPLMRQGKWSEVVTLLNAHLTEVSADSTLAADLGWAYFKLGDFEAAATHIRVAISIDAEIASSHWALGFALMETGDAEAAEREFKTALSLGDHHVAWIGLALLYLRGGDLEAAERTHRAAMERRPESRERVEAFADFLSDVGRDAEAREAYLRSTLLWPESRRDVH